eukprot:COSAG01_NODE_2509_length_7549_cov_22.865235_8_plen_59_part_00
MRLVSDREKMSCTLVNIFLHSQPELLYGSQPKFFETVVVVLVSLDMQVVGLRIADKWA